MATATQLEGLKEEATCAICLEYFTDPVFLECGNVFCRCCITGCWEGLESNFSCPQCRETFPNKLLRPNRPLANIVEMLKQFSFPGATPQEENRLPGAATQETRLCGEHDEKLKLFCENDQKPICVVCSMSRDCKPHAILPIREAAQEYRDKFQNYLDKLKRKLEDVDHLQSKEEERVAEMEDKFKRKRDQIKYEFEKLQQFLEKEKSQHLSSLEEEERQSLQRIRTNVAKFADFRSSLIIVLGEIESKCQQEDVELLTDMKSILQRYENMKIQHPDLQCFKGKGDGKGEEEVMVNEHEKEEDLKMKIIQALEWRWAIDFADEVTLDPSSAHPWLIVSEDGRNVRLGDRDQELPDTAQRFDPHLYVLGRKKLSSGRHYWEVETHLEKAWRPL
ncbi:E3 ubiquitin-protein ligase TRIM39-like isoform X2 [Ambystoma mexicanum]|uniref:E3 ubiquitin-protein ligase TRIM39-like isoform X2 n=1 Tax=Ambystoma mexicanum TaxID=8296 RepID=UPI0037E8B55C